jgi:hypothetical protein
MFQNPVDFKYPDIKQNTEANARAEMLIFLIENKHFSVDKVNEIISKF